MFEYKSLNPLFVQAFSVALSFDAKLTISGGSFDFTPLAVRWCLNVSISTNGRKAHFEIVENMLKSFIESKFLQNDSLRMETYTQVPGGFSAIFAPELMDSSRHYSRRYVKSIDLDFKFVHADQAVEPLFDQMTQLADYAMCCLYRKLVELVPAIFTDQYKRVLATEDNFEPLALALGLDSQLKLRSAAEKEYLASEKRPEIVWGYDEEQMFFNSVQYERRNFIPITDEPDEAECTHEHVYWNQIVESVGE